MLEFILNAVLVIGVLFFIIVAVVEIAKWLWTGICLIGSIIYAIFYYIWLAFVVAFQIVALPFRLIRKLVNR